VQNVRFLTSLILCLALAPAAEARGKKPAPKPPVPPPVVGLGGYWRQHVTLTPPMISVATAKAAGLKTGPAARMLAAHSRRGRKRALAWRTTPPPDGWMKPDFDDSAWGRVRGRAGSRHEFGLICRRARFAVNDSAGVKKLSLDAGYVGGIVVYLNGREIARAGLPQGALTPDTPGDDYPVAAFVVSDGARKGKLLHHYTDRALKQQFALRGRKLGPVEVPASALRKGVNVLAVELHRSGYPAVCRKQGAGQFAPVGLGRLSLRAEAADGAITLATVRPKGLRMWNADVAEEVTQLDYADPSEPLKPVRILALRNGTYSGQVVVGSTQPLAGVTAEAGPLVGKKTGKRLPAESVTVRYARLGTRVMRLHGGSVYGGPAGVNLGVHFQRFDPLVDTPPATVKLSRPGNRLSTAYREAIGLPGVPSAAAMLPMWITVRVPRDAVPDLYASTLTIRVKDQPDTAVPVEVEVFDWTLPDIKDYASAFSVYQSPDTLAAYYKVPLWSEKHWALIEKSVKLIGEASNHSIIIPLLSKEQVGNEESYVKWLKQADGTFKHDTTVMERYVDLFLKYHPLERIDSVCLIMWGNAGVAAGNPYQKHKYDKNGLPLKTRGKFTVTTVDAKTGAKSDMALPPLGSPEYRTFWTAALKVVEAKLADRKLARRIRVGMPADPGVPAMVVKVFHDLLPDSGWFVGNHPGSRGYRYDLKDRKKLMPSLHVERVYTGPLPDPAKKRLFGWRRGQMALAFNRYGFSPVCLYPTANVWAFRILMEADLASGHRGAGRIGADYWRMGLKSRSGGAGTFYARYPYSGIGQTGLGANCADLLAPGPDGPVTTVRFENAREGIQNAEVVIALQKALLAKKITGDAAARAWRVLDERTNAMRTHTMGIGRGGWQARDRRLCETAAALLKND
jgi:glycosyl hydrolase family 123